MIMCLQYTRAEARGAEGRVAKHLPPGSNVEGLWFRGRGRFPEVLELFRRLCFGSICSVAILWSTL